MSRGQAYNAGGRQPTPSTSSFRLLQVRERSLQRYPSLTGAILAWTQQAGKCRFTFTNMPVLEVMNLLHFSHHVLRALPDILAGGVAHGRLLVIPQPLSAVASAIAGGQFIGERLP